MTPPPDERAGRLARSALSALGSLVGAERAGAAAAAVMRRRARTAATHERESRRLVADPGVVTLPRAWWDRPGRRRARRLGLELSLDLRDNVQRVVYFTGAYEPLTLGWLRHGLRPGDVYVDIGAHIGLHALVAARTLRGTGGRVIAFEPSPDSAARLRQAAAANGLDIELVELALGAAPGRVALRTDAAWGVADAGVRSQFNDGPVVVEAERTSLDAWTERRPLNRLDIVKIDCEGAEVDVLAGMRKTLASHRPRAVLVECRPQSLRRASRSPAELRDVLASAGYRATGETMERNEVYAPS